MQNVDLIKHDKDEWQIMQPYACVGYDICLP